MPQDKETIITMFQVSTGVTDILLAIRLLEDAKWNLAEAICKIVSPELRKSYPKKRPIFKKRPLKNIMPRCSTTSNQQNPNTQEVSETTPPRILTFNVKYGNRKIQLKLPDTCNFLDIKQKLSEILNVDVNDEVILLRSNSGIYENIPFSSLVLPPEVNMLLTLKETIATQTSE